MPHTLSWFIEQKKRISPRAKHAIALAIVLTVSLVAHSVNMFGFPAYREDEGTYMSQAAEILKAGRLAPYTYWYDHAPAGWIFISLWQLMTDWMIEPAMSVDLGRIFMAVLQVSATWFVYHIVFHLTKKRDASIVAALLFALNPTGIIFHRRVFIDNMMTWWFLLSLFLLTASRRLIAVITSAMAFGIAVLTKESSIAFFPMMVVLVTLQAHKNHRHFAGIAWASISLFIISLYPLSALLAGEFFPTGTLFGGIHPHVSLIDALRFHMGRSGGAFWEPGSSFRLALTDSWWRYGPISLVMGTIATVYHLRSAKRRWPFCISLLTLSYTALFLLRGQVLDWYITPLIPLFAINIGLLYDDIVYLITLWRPQLKHYRFAFGTMLILLVASELSTKGYIFTLKQTTNEVLAVDWIKDNLPPNALLLIDNYAFVDLNPYVTDITKTNIHYYWKVDTDPQIKTTVFNNDWESIDYLLLTPALTKTIYNDNLTLVKEAYEKSYVIARFNENDIKNEGYPVEIREVNNRQSTKHQSWNWFRENMITAEGAVIDPSANNQTTSEGQSYAMLRAVWENDQEMFHRVWQWTNKHLKQDRTHLFVWLATERGSKPPLIRDHASAADADEDIALALLFAGERWDNTAYIDSAKAIMSDIWAYEIVSIAGRRYMVSGTNAARPTGYLINPSYFSPATYRIFAQVDHTHDWNALADDVYAILDDLDSHSTFQNSSTHLVPNWFLLHKDGTFDTPFHYTKRDATLYSYDAFRLYWRLALDAVWFKTPEAKTALENVAPFFRKEWYKKGSIAAEYNLQGTPQVSYSDISTSVGALSVFYITDPGLAIELYSKQYWPAFRSGYWGQPSKYYAQNWGWFGTALYTNSLPNLWSRGTQVAKK